MTIAITGATGHLGQHVIQQLLQLTTAHNIVAVVRNLHKAEHLRQQGIEVREADYTNSIDLNQALQGVDQLLLISSSEIGQREIQHKNVIDAAQQQGVSHIIYTSLLNADKTPILLADEHLKTEQYLKDSGLNYTILRNAWYIENYTENLSGVLQSGVVLGAGHDGRISAATRQDYAQAAAVVLTGDLAQHAQKTYELAGDKAFSLVEYAAKVSEYSGKDVIYQNLPSQEYQEKLQQAGLPENFAHILADSDQGIAAGFFYSDDKTLHHLIGHASTSIDDAIQAALK